jgi:hypothetical protein
VPDLFALHEAAGIQLRVLPNLWPFWQAVTGSTLGFSGIRLRNALPAPPVAGTPPSSTVQSRSRTTPSDRSGVIHRP